METIKTIEIDGIEFLPNIANPFGEIRIVHWSALVADEESKSTSELELRTLAHSRATELGFAPWRGGALISRSGGYRVPSSNLHNTTQRIKQLFYNL